MKNRILVFLVFITTILKGQSVDPETFPTVVGEIGNKNLYTNTGGEGKVAIKTIMDSVTSVSIPLSGTEVGKPVTGDIQISNNDNPINFYSGDLNGNAKGFQTWTDDNSFKLFSITGGIEDASMQIGTLGISISASDSLAFGLTGQQDYTANITDLDYTQKIYVDTKASKLGADDIEISDFNKGVILTSPNGSRYRITVDNSGILTTTIIP